MFPPGFTCPAVLWIRSARFRFRLRASHPLWRTFPRPSANFHSRTTVRTPKIRRPSVWPPPRSLATTCGISVDVFSCPYLDVSVQGVPRVRLFCSPHADTVLPCRVSPFGNLRINAYVPLPGAYRSLSRPSSAPDAKAFPLRSYQLDHFWFSIMNYAGHRRISFYRSNCSCYPIIPQYLFSDSFRCLTLCCLASSLLLFVQFSRCSPGQRPDQNAQRIFKRFDPFFDGGDKRDRTADLLRAKQALSRLSYTPEGNWWALVGSNHRPYDYQSYALAS